MIIVRLYYRPLTHFNKYLKSLYTIRTHFYIYRMDTFPTCSLLALKHSVFTHYIIHLSCTFRNMHTRIYTVRAHTYTRSYIRSHTRSYIRSYTRSSSVPTHVLTYAPTHVLTYVPTHVLTYAPTHVLTYVSSTFISGARYHSTFQFI